MRMFCEWKCNLFEKWGHCNSNQITVYVFRKEQERIINAAKYTYKKKSNLKIKLSVIWYQIKWHTCKKCTINFFPLFEFCLFLGYFEEKSAFAIVLGFVRLYISFKILTFFKRLRFWLRGILFFPLFWNTKREVNYLNLSSYLKPIMKALARCLRFTFIKHFLRTFLSLIQIVYIRDAISENYKLLNS